MVWFSFLCCRISNEGCGILRECQGCERASVAHFLEPTMFRFSALPLIPCLFTLACASSPAAKNTAPAANTITGAEDGTTVVRTAGQQLTVPARLALTLKEQPGLTHADYVDQLTGCTGHILWQPNGSARSHETFVKN